MINSTWTINTKHLPKEENEQQPKAKKVPVKKSYKKIISSTQHNPSSSLDFDSILKAIIASSQPPITIADKDLSDNFLFTGGDLDMICLPSSEEEKLDLCKLYGIDSSNVKTISVLVEASTNIHKITIEKHIS